MSAFIIDILYYTMVWPGHKNSHYNFLDSPSDVEYSKEAPKKRSDFSFWDCVRKMYLCRENCIILCHCTLSNGILYLFEGTGTPDTGKWKNCNTFLSFCLAILSLIRSRVVASVLCDTMRCIGLLGIADAPLQEIKKACDIAVFSCGLSRHINISDGITPG